MKKIGVVKHTFPPLINKDSKILILGSIPSVTSRKLSFYYMHPQNRFYKVLSRLFLDDFYHADIEKKKILLKKYGIALYDIIEECEIQNSDDSSIRNVVYSNIDELIENTSINTIFLNGKKAFELFKKRYPNFDKEVIALPSTSSANARTDLETLIKAWEVLLRKL